MIIVKDVVNVVVVFVVTVINANKIYHTFQVLIRKGNQIGAKVLVLIK